MFLERLWRNQFQKPKNIFILFGNSLPKVSENCSVHKMSFSVHKSGVSVHIYVVRTQKCVFRTQNKFRNIPNSFRKLVNNVRRPDGPSGSAAFLKTFIAIRIERGSEGIHGELARVVDLSCHVGSFSRASLTRVVDKSRRLVVSHWLVERPL